MPPAYSAPESVSRQAEGLHAAQVGEVGSPERCALVLKRNGVMTYNLYNANSFKNKASFIMTICLGVKMKLHFDTLWMMVVPRSSAKSSSYSTKMVRPQHSVRF